MQFEQISLSDLNSNISICYAFLCFKNNFTKHGSPLNWKKKNYQNTKSELKKVINLYIKKNNNTPPKDSSILYPSLASLKKNIYKHTKLILGYKNTCIPYEKSVIFFKLFSSLLLLELVWTTEKVFIVQYMGGQPRNFRF